MNDLHEICDAAYNDMADVAKEIKKKGGIVSSGMLDVADKLSHTIKSLETVNAMNEYGDERYHGSRYYRDGDDGYNYDGYVNRGYGNQRRDSRGRYRDSGEEIADELRKLMDKAPDEQSKDAIRRAMETVKR